MQSGNQQEEKPKEKLTPEQEAEQAVENKKREATQAVWRKFNWDAFGVGISLKRSDNAPNTPEENEADPGVAQISTARKSPGKLRPGYHDLTYMDGKQQKTRKLHLDEKGFSVYYANPRDRPAPERNFKAFLDDAKWTMRGNALHSGNEQIIDYPSAGRDPNDRDSKDNLSKINLKATLAIVEQAIKDGISLSTPANGMLEKRLSNPKNEKEAKLCSDIRNQMAISQMNVRFHEVTIANNINTLKEDLASLKTKSDELAPLITSTASTANVEIAAKFKEIEALRKKIDTQVTKIANDMNEREIDNVPELTDRYKKTTDKYTSTIESAKATINEVNTQLSSPAVQAKLPPDPKEGKAVVDNFVALAKKTNDLSASVAAKNAPPAPPPPVPPRP